MSEQNITHYVFDVETLGLGERSVVTALSCVPFEFERRVPYIELVESGIFIKFSVEEQIKQYKRTVHKDTIAWWKTQPKEARELSILPSSKDELLHDGLVRFTKWLETQPYDSKLSYLWSRGNYFDFPKIESLFDDAKVIFPMNTWMIRDVRTYIDVLTGSTNGYCQTPKIEGAVKHHALHDCARDAHMMQYVFSQITE